MPDAKKSLTAHVPGILAERVASTAARQKRSNNWVVNQALELYLSIEEERHAHTLKALADVKAGRLLDHEAVKAWAAGLTMAPQSTTKRRLRHRCQSSEPRQPLMIWIGFINSLQSSIPMLPRKRFKC